MCNRKAEWLKFIKRAQRVYELLVSHSEQGTARHQPAEHALQDSLNPIGKSKSALSWFTARRQTEAVVVIGEERALERKTYGVRTHSSRIHPLLIHVSCLTEWINGKEDGTMA